VAKHRDAGGRTVSRRLSCSACAAEFDTGPFARDCVPRARGNEVKGMATKAKKPKKRKETNVPTRKGPKKR
jgi:hypothetical protein